ncbi:hypothetical protein BCF46_0043 [Litoreibacter meonggei]|uniref:DUF2867 domain-containing protein n=1 Tax=Litoreibacter meonggei TaxID=1049199 RepID=A0A497X2H2_9RHOB|nr:hypothetical protein [Litoreibacter meonggei]RLJ59853.1 hypothetical protein BCF46_0043 [Litoreibacter meonggei]
MLKVSTPPLPDDALLRLYADGSGHYTDCFAVTMPQQVSLPEFVEAFYTAPLFRCERVVLKLAARRPSSDTDAADIANGKTTRFAGWDVEDRSENQLLMSDMASRTRSWFMTREASGGTRLYFGSAVTADQKTGKLGFLFNALLPIHQLYSYALLKGAVRRVSQGPAQAVAR